MGLSPEGTTGARMALGFATGAEEIACSGMPFAHNPRKGSGTLPDAGGSGNGGSAAALMHHRNCFNRQTQKTYFFEGEQRRNVWTHTHSSSFPRKSSHATSGDSNGVSTVKLIGREALTVWRGRLSWIPRAHFDSVQWHKTRNENNENGKE